MDKNKNKFPRLKLKNPILIVAWPGMGDVAYKVALNLIEKLKMEEFFVLNPESFFYPTGVTIKNDLLDLTELPYSKFFVYKNKAGSNDLVVFISNAQPDLVFANNYCDALLDFIIQLKIKIIFSFAAMPLPIDHLTKPNVWAAVTDKELIDIFGKYNVKFMKEGHVSGMNGLFLGMAKKRGIKGVCLLGEIPLYAVQLENPRAAIAILEILMSMLSINISLKDLEMQAQEIQGQIEQLIDFLKGGGSAPPPIGDEEIEHLKYTLGQYTNLPQSVKLRIEQLFEEAKKDLKNATILKQELDKWGIYKEYEDRFLDLFKKQKPRGN
ncbi:MAG: PAC2 family protein [Candidatus Omnitrophota bacterium]